MTQMILDLDEEENKIVMDYAHKRGYTNKADTVKVIIREHDRMVKENE